MVKVWYSVKEAARFLGVGVRTIHRLIKSDNPNYDSMVVKPNEIQIEGKVIWYGRELR